MKRQHKNYSPSFKQKAVELSFAKRTISGVEVVRMIKKDQLLNPKSSTYKSFISLASYPDSYRERN